MIFLQTLKLYHHWIAIDLLEHKFLTYLLKEKKKVLIEIKSRIEKISFHLGELPDFNSQFEKDFQKQYLADMTSTSMDFFYYFLKPKLFCQESSVIVLHAPKSEFATAFRLTESIPSLESKKFTLTWVISPQKNQ